VTKTSNSASPIIALRDPRHHCLYKSTGNSQPTTVLKPGHTAALRARASKRFHTHIATVSRAC
jgi:hypothetical protein